MRIVVEVYAEKFVVPGIKKVYYVFLFFLIVLSTVINDNLNSLNI